MYNIAIVEDDKSFADLLSSYIKRFGEEESEEFNIIHYPNGMLFLENYRAVHDIVFMDIAMPDFDGMETARQLRKVDENVKLIFATNMAQFAINGYEVDAIDFMLKPVNYFQLSVKMKKAIKSIGKNADVSFFIKHDEELKKIYERELLYVEVQNHWLIYHTTGGNYKIRGTLNKLKDQMVGHSFAQCNSCYLVNLNYVNKIVDNTVTVGKEKLQISHSRKKEFLALLANYMGGYR